MIYLIIVSVIWSLSFSLIKGVLTGVDPYFVAFIRLFVSFIVFIPFLRIKKINQKLAIHLIVIGALQYGLMYLAYIYSYQYLKAFEVAILTIFTPIFVVIIYDLWSKKFTKLYWIKALLAVVGASIIIYSDNTTIGFWKGILLIQASNILFALGQIYYKKIIEKESSKNQKNHYALMFFGAVIVTSIFSFSFTDFSSLEITSKQWLTLLYLGAVASGLGFFLWNVGVTKVETGTLSVMNNLKIPLGIIFAFLILSESVNFIQFIIGSVFIIFALAITEKTLILKT